MNRQTLTDATNLQDVPAPTYLLEQIAEGTKASARDAEKTADFLLGRLAKSNLVVKLKALQTISFCVREGSPAFADAVREETGEISSYLQYSGPPDPVVGDERYRRIRVAAQEVMVCLNDRTIQEHSSWEQPSNAEPYGQGAAGGYGASNSTMRSPSQPSQSSMGMRWGPSGGSNDMSAAASASRPTTYSDNAGQYGGSSGGGYGGPQGQYGGNSGGYGGSGYGNSDSRAQESSGGYGGNTSQQSGRFGSWSQPSGGMPATNAPKGGGGMWSRSGFQQVTPPQNYGSSSSYSSRDNRPTVLVGQTVGVSTSASRYGGMVGSGGMMGGGFSGAASAGFGGAGRGSQPTRLRSGFSSSSSGQQRSYIENMNRMLSAPAGAGMPGVDPMMGDMGPKSTIEKTYEGLKKIGFEAKDRWDARKMDKSVTSSLAAHDELTSTPGNLDRTYFHPSMHQATGGGDKTGDYERGLIDNLCAAGGLARAPPSDMLKRFVELSHNLEVQTIGDIMLDKLEDNAWQVRLKALHVVLALIEDPGSSAYVELFEDNAGVLEELRSDSKPTVAAKALQVLQVLGLAGADEVARPATRGTPRSPAARSPARRAPPQPQQEVDILGMASLSLDSAPSNPPPQAQQPQMYSAVPQQQQAPAASLDLLGSVPAAASPPAAMQTPRPAAPIQVSLLDGFDDVNQQPQQQQQQQQQQAYAQPNQGQPVPQPQMGMLLPEQDQSKALGDFGKDMFAIATSPRSAAVGDAGSDVSGAATTTTSEQSAFSFI